MPSTWESPSGRSRSAGRAPSVTTRAAAAAGLIEPIRLPSLSQLPPLTLAAIRSGAAGVARGGYAWLAGERLRLPLRGGVLLPLAIFTAPHTANIALLHLGMAMTSAGRATVLFFTQPVWVTFLSPWMVQEERLTGGRVLGILLAFSGFVVVFLPEIGGEQPVVVGDLLYLAVGHIAFGFVLWGALIRRHGPAAASTFLFLVPLFSVLIGVVFLGEVPTGPLLVGAALIAAGIVLTSRAPVA